MSDSPWAGSTWGELAVLEYGRALSDYKTKSGPVRVYGTNGPIGFAAAAQGPGPTVVVGRKGAYRGVHYSPGPFWVIDTAYWLRPTTDIDLRWAHYQLLTQDINGRDSGSAIPSLNRSDFDSLRVSVPPLPEQHAIAEVLGALDDKIEANDRLEATSWSLVSAHADGMMRNAQERVKVGSLIDLSYGKALPSETRVGGPVSVVGSSGVVGSHDVSLVRGPGVVVGRKGTPAGSKGHPTGMGSVHWCAADFWPIDTTFYVNQASIPMLFSFFLLQGLGLASMDSDSAVPGLNRNATLNLDVLLPAASDLRAFERLAEPIVSFAESAKRENVLLAHMRSSLLPKLLSGELRVRDAEDLVSEAV